MSNFFLLLPHFISMRLERFHFPLGILTVVCLELEDLYLGTEPQKLLRVMMFTGT